MTFELRTFHGERGWMLYRHHPNGTRSEAAQVSWAVELAHPSLTRERLERALNTTPSQSSGSTWSWAPCSGTLTAWLLRAGRDVGSVQWMPNVTTRTERLAAMDAICSALCEERAPEVAREPEYVPGDHDFATGEDVHAA